MGRGRTNKSANITRACPPFFYCSVLSKSAGVFFEGTIFFYLSKNFHFNVEKSYGNAFLKMKNFFAYKKKKYCPPRKKHDPPAD